MAEPAPESRSRAQAGNAEGGSREPGTGVSLTLLERLSQGTGFNEDDRDDARQVIALAISAAQRERDSAQTYYMRGRNVIAFTAALFTAVQTAFVSSVGREVEGVALLSSGERLAVAIPAFIAVVLVAIAVGKHVGSLDKARDGEGLGEKSLTSIWLDPDHDRPTLANGQPAPALFALALGAVKEEGRWATENESRRTAARDVARWCAGAGAFCLVELVALYVGLA